MKSIGVDESESVRALKARQSSIDEEPETTFQSNLSAACERSKLDRTSEIQIQGVDCRTKDSAASAACKAAPVRAGTIF